MIEKEILNLIDQAQSVIDEALMKIMYSEHRQDYKVGKLGQASGLLHEFKKPIYERNPDLRPAPPSDLEEPVLSEDEIKEIAKIPPEKIEEIDDALLALATDRFQKVALIVGNFMSSPLHSDNINCFFYAQRIEKIVEKGLLESQGNLKLMRYSEVRKAEIVPKK